MLKESKLSKEEVSLIEKIDKSKLPHHVAIIMDGNGRWAKKRGLPRIKGHERGIKRAGEILDLSVYLGIKYLTLYTFSKENWKRPKSEVDFLMSRLKDYLKKNRKKVKEENIRFQVIGDKEDLDSDLQEIIRETEEESKENTGLTLSLALSYGGRQEILKAVNKILKEGFSKIDEGKFSTYLFPVPDVDLLIRTSGEYRVSNFLLWQIAYAEFYFTKKLWPEFKRKEYLKALLEYQRRERRFGGI